MFNFAWWPSAFDPLLAPLVLLRAPQVRPLLVIDLSRIISEPFHILHHGRPA